MWHFADFADCCWTRGLEVVNKKHSIDCYGYFWNASSFYPLIKEHITRWWFHRFLIFTPTWRWSNLTNIFQMGWFNHQPDQYEMKKDLVQNKLSTSYQRCVVTMVYWRGTSEARRIIRSTKLTHLQVSRNPSNLLKFWTDWGRTRSTTSKLSIVSISSSEHMRWQGSSTNFVGQCIELAWTKQTWLLWWITTKAKLSCRKVGKQCWGVVPASLRKSSFRMTQATQPCVSWSSWSVVARHFQCYHHKNQVVDTYQLTWKHWSVNQRTRKQIRM